MTGLNMTGFKMNKIENQKLIFASLLLNLFLICSIAGGAYKLFANHKTGKAGQNALRFAAENLSQEQQHRFKKTLREARRESKPLLETANEARTEVRELIAAPSLDRQAVEVALAKTREADRAVRMKIEVTMLNFAETLSAEDRQKLAEGLAQKGPLREPPMMTIKDD
jgi:uncharacterized membrane protein